MRTPLERATGSPGFITLRGKRYRCLPLKLRHFCEAKAFLVQLAPDPLKELAEENETFSKFAPDIQKALALKALELKEQRKNIAATEAAEWINGEEGILFLFWCMIRDSHPEFATLDKVFETFPPGNDNGGLTIPEAELIRRKIDEITLDSVQPDIDKKKAMDRKRKKMLKKKTAR